MHELLYILLILLMCIPIAICLAIVIPMLLVALMLIILVISDFLSALCSSGKEDRAMNKESGQSDKDDDDVNFV